jgi:nucleoside-diphosphate-sugar epimerase
MQAKRKFSKDYILITGINGFIGKYVANELLRKKYDVIGISLEDKCLVGNKDLIYEKVDITNFEEMKKIFKSYHIDRVIHLAAIVHQNPGIQTRKLYYDVNYLASKNIFEQCVENNVRKILFASTVEVYGQQEQKVISEDFECNPSSVYGETKLLAEEALKSVAGDKINYAILRFAPVYAKDFKLNIDKRIYRIPGRLAYYFKGGDYSFNFCSVNNIVSFILTILRESNFESGIYNLSDSKNYDVKQIISLEKKYCDLKWIVKLPYYACLLFISMYEKIHYRLFKKTSFLSVHNFEKLFKGVVYSNMKVRNIVGDFEWNIVNTLYKYKNVEKNS